MVAVLPPKCTEVAASRFVPVIVTDVPPAVGPDVGLMLVTAGRGGETYVNSAASRLADVPPAVVTFRLTVLVPAGAVTVMVVAVSVRMVAVLAPKCTDVAPSRFVPVMVTTVPPAAGPDVGVLFVTVGLAATT
jgi:hypothetical protein